MGIRDCRRRFAGASVGCMVIALMLVSPRDARAANNCPWMNEATASGLLGASAIVKYTGTAPFQPGTCTFVSSSNSGARTLTIQVEIPTDAHVREMAILKECGAKPVELRAIGNEAWICETPGARSSGLSFVVGRVRNQVFFIRFRSNLRNDPLRGSELQQSRSYSAAEEVSGNLF